VILLSFFELCDFALYYSHINAILPPSQRSKQVQIRKYQGQNGNDLLKNKGAKTKGKFKGEITKLKKIRAKPKLHFKAGARTPKKTFRK